MATTFRFSISCQESIHHSFLSHQDVLGLIAAHFHPGPTIAVEELTRRQGQLFHLALSCRAFQHPALDTLWSYMEELSHLLKLLPCKFDRASNFYKLVTPIDRYTWDHFLIHARRIRAIHFGDFRPLADTAWTDVLRELPHLPRDSEQSIIHLTSLTFSRENLHIPSICASMELFDPKSLQTLKFLHLVHTSYLDILKPHVTSLLANDSDLTQLNISGYIEEETVMLLPKFPRLRTLELTIQGQHITSSFFHRLIENDSLEVVNLDLLKARWIVYPPTDGESSHRSVTFRKLRDLHITGPCRLISYLFSILGSSEQPVLQSVTLAMPIETHNNDQILTLLRYLSEGAKPSLTAITLKNRTSLHRMSIHGDWVHHLRKLPSLRNLIIEGRADLSQPAENEDSSLKILFVGSHLRIVKFDDLPASITG